MVMEFLTGFGILIGYFVICVALLLLFRYFVKTSDEVFRKILHLVLLCSLLVFVYAFQTWWVSVIAAIAFIILVFPILSFAECIKGYSDLLTERKNGELKRSLVVVFCMFALMLSIGWGWLGERWLVLACVYAWGFGDGAAALIGKKFGEHHLEGKLIEGRKSVEGTLAMFSVSFLSVLVILLVSGNIVWFVSLPIALLTAAGCAAVELYTRNGMDTITCPLAAAAVILPLVNIYWGHIQ